MTPSTRLPGFPRWTGARWTYRTNPAAQSPGVLTVRVSVRITHRARLWAAWRLTTGREVITRGTP